MTIERFYSILLCGKCAQGHPGQTTQAHACIGFNELTSRPQQVNPDLFLLAQCGISQFFNKTEIPVRVDDDTQGFSDVGVYHQQITRS